MTAYDHTWLIGEWERMGRPEVEYLYCDGQETPVWMNDKDPVFYDDVLYRIKCKPQINWGHVSDDVVALATDKGGKSYLYDSKPNEKKYLWHSGDDYSRAETFASFTPGTCAWNDSLVMRPVLKQ